MKKIADLLTRDLNETIEEIIKVDQADEETVYNELTEYVATNRIRESYRTLLKAMAEAPADPSEGVGIWISGFFGSGKLVRQEPRLRARQPHRARPPRRRSLQAQLNDAIISDLVTSSPPRSLPK